MSYAKQNYIKAKMALEFAKMGVRSTAVSVSILLVEAKADEVEEILRDLNVALEVLADAREELAFAKKHFEQNKDEGETLDDVKLEEEE